MRGGDLNPPFAEGTRNIVKTFIQALSKRGHKIIVLTRKRSRLNGAKLNKFEEINGIKFFRWSNYLDFFYLYKKIIKKEKIDVVQIFSKGTRPSYYFKLLKFVGNAPLIFSLLGLPSLESRDKSKKKVVDSLKNADLCLVSSNVLFKELKDAGLENSHYIPFGIDLNKFRPEKNVRKKNEIICIRPVSKNLLMAFEKVNENFKNVKIKLNKSIFNKKLKSEIEIKSLNNIFFLGNQKDMSPIYNSSEIMIDLHNPKKHLECASPPVAILEAMACKTKVISTKIPEIEEIIKDGKTGFLVKTNGKEEIYLKIREALKKKDAIEKSALKMVQKKYDILKIVKKYELIYKSLTNFRKFRF